MATIVQRQKITGVDRDSFIEAPQSFPVSFELRENQPHIGISGHRLRIDLERLSERLVSFIEATALKLQYTQKMGRIELLPIGGQHEPAGELGFTETAGGMS